MSALHFILFFYFGICLFIAIETRLLATLHFQNRIHLEYWRLLLIAFWIKLYQVWSFLLLFSSNLFASRKIELFDTIHRHTSSLLNWFSSCGIELSPTLVYKLRDILTLLIFPFKVNSFNNRIFPPFRNRPNHARCGCLLLVIDASAYIWK